MKTQILSTLTDNKVWILFFLTFLHLKRTESGNAFKNCLSSRSNVPTTHEYLINYLKTRPAIKSEEKIWLCCGNPICQNCCLACPYGTSNYACGNLSGKIYCNQWPSNCKGVVDDFSVNEINNNSCLDINYAKSVVTSNLQGLDRGYAYVECSNGTNCYPSCTWDNNGWICGSLWGGIWGECFVTWPAPWPGSEDKNPFTSSTTTISIIQATPSLPIPTNPETINDDHLVEKIAIPIGIIAGTSLVSGSTYYFCKKKRRRQRQNLITNSGDQIETIELAGRELPALIGVNENRQTVQISPISQSSSIKEMLINQLKNKLVGYEQLWNNYLEVNNLLINNPNSQILMQNFSQLQNQLLQILTISEIGLLLENNVGYLGSLNSQMLWNNEITESSLQRNLYPSLLEPEETRNPQWIDYQLQEEANNYRNPEWRG